MASLSIDQALDMMERPEEEPAPPFAPDPAPSRSPRQMAIDEALNEMAWYSTEDPGFIESTAYGGVVEAPARGAGMVAGAARAGLSAYEVLTGQELGMIPPGPMNVMTNVTNNVRSGLEDLTGLDNPPTRGDSRAAMEGSAGLAMTSPFLPAAGPLAPLMAGISYGAPYMGEVLRQRAEAGGAGSIGQLSASLAPEVLAMGIPAGYAKGPQILTKLQNGLKTLRLSKDAEAFRRSLGVTKEQLTDAASVFKRVVPQHPEDAQKYVDEWIEILEESIASLDAGEFPTTGQMIQAHQDIGEALSGVERMIAGMGEVQWGRKYAGNKKATLEALQAKYNTLRPEETIDATTSAYRSIRNQRYEAQSALWTPEMKAAMPDVDVRAERWAAQQAIGRSENPSNIAPEVKLMAAWPDNIPWERWQNMRRDVLRRGRKSADALQDTTELAKKQSITPELKEAMGDTMQRLQRGAKGKKYKKALEATAKFYRDFDDSRKIIRTLDKFKGDTDLADSSKILNGILRADNAAGEARHATRILAQSPKGVRGLQGSFIDHVFGTLWEESFNPRQAAAIRKRWAKFRSVGEELLDKEQVQVMDDLVEKMGWTANISGTSAAPFGTGSNVPPWLETILSAAPGSAQVSGVRAMTGKAMDVVRNTLGQPTHQIRSRIIIEAVLNPELGKTLLKVPVEAMPDAWLVNWNRLTKAAAARGATQGIANQDITADEAEFARSAIARTGDRSIESITNEEVAKFLKAWKGAQ